MRHLNAWLVGILIGLPVGALSQQTAVAPASEARAAAAEEVSDPLANAIDARLVSKEMIGTTQAVRGRILEVQPSTHPRMPNRLIIRRDPQLSIIYYPDVAEAIEKQLGKPKAGMWVYARGPVGEWRGLMEMRVSKGGAIRFYSSDTEASTLPVVIESVEALESIRFNAPRVVIKDFDDHLEKPARVIGQVVAYQLPSSERAPHVIKFSDGTGDIDVVYWDIAPDVDQRALRPGTRLEIQGTAGRYRDRKQLRIRDPRDIRVITGDEAAAAPVVAAPPSGRVPIATLGEKVGQKVIIEGQVAEVTAPWSDRAPNILRVEDSSGAVEVVFWDDLKPQLNQDLIRQNARVRVSGEVSEHREKIQIRVEQPGQLSAATP